MSPGALARAMDSLEGLSCGDAFGECFFALQHEQALARVLPAGPWRVTDDTLMAISVVETLRRHGEIAEDQLAGHFAALYHPSRGYGAAMHGLLGRIRSRGTGAWQVEAQALFAGQGSFGNGAAMRVAPLGAYFAPDLDAVVEQARRSARTTHAHPEAAAGAIAVAVAAALAWRGRLAEPTAPRGFLGEVLAFVPPGSVHAGIEHAMHLPEHASALAAAAVLGNGDCVSAADTVPFVLWCAGRFLANYEEALWAAVSAGGDMDTTCAMVGGIIAARVGAAGVPQKWHHRREPIEPLLSSVP